MSGAVQPRTAAPALQAFGDEIAAALAEVAALRLKNGIDSSEIMTARLQLLRAEATADLRALGDEVVTHAATATSPTYVRDSIRYAWRVVGRYAELVARLDRQPFVVLPDFDADDLIVDIAYEVRDAPIPANVGALKSELDTAVNVIRAVMNDRMRTLDPVWSSMTRRDVALLQQDYLKHLVGIARVGLETTEPTRAEFARADLLRVTSLFTLREAGIVKNAYVNRLGVWSALAAFVFAALYVLIDNHVLSGDGIWSRVSSIAYVTRNFHLLACGTALGTWLSFSLRRQELSFADLAVLEPDRLEPAARVMFMIGLSGLVGLLLFTGAIVAGIGTVTGLEGMREHGTWALLLGLLAGVAERGLGSAVSKRSQDFSAVVGGGPAVPPTIKS